VEGLEQSPIAEYDKNRLMGEALFLRAFIHFYIVNLFGEIPYIATTNYRVNASIKKLSEDELYESIIADLEVAKGLLKSGSGGTNKTHVGEDAVRAFLARVYLYDKQWSKAELEAD